MTVTEDRVAFQAAVLSALRDARGGEPVWPGTPLAELRLDVNRRAAVAADVMRTLHVDVAPGDFAAPTASALIDALEERAERGSPVVA